MNEQLIKRIALLVLAGSLSACATGPGGGSIYVPTGGEDAQAPPPPQVEGQTDEPRIERKSEQPTTERKAPSYQDEGDALPPAAQSLLTRADSLLAAGDAQSAVSQLERAQRIAPRSAAVYFGL